MCVCEYIDTYLYVYIYILRKIICIKYSNCYFHTSSHSIFLFFLELKLPEFIQFFIAFNFKDRIQFFLPVNKVFFRFCIFYLLLLLLLQLLHFEFLCVITYRSSVARNRRAISSDKSFKSIKRFTHILPIVFPHRSPLP